MPKIDFCFQGWVTGAQVNEVTITATGKNKDVSREGAEDVAEKMDSGEYSIALGDYLYDNHPDSEIELFDFAKGD